VRDYILQRLLLAALTVVAASLVISVMVRLLPGDMVEQIAAQYGGRDVEAFKQELRQTLGLDKPFTEQYLTWVGGLLRGDAGTSLYSGEPVTEEIARTLPPTVEIGVIALAFGVVVSIPIGVISGLRQDSLWDYLLRGGAIVALSLPAFWVATLLIVLPSIWWNWSPPARYVPLLDDPRRNLSMMIFPGVILGVVLSGTLIRLTRAQMLEVLRQDYVRTAYAKGLRQRAVVVRHALKNALIPVTTVIGLQVTVLVGGTLILERVFNVPGMGNYLFTAVNNRDYTVVQTVTVLFAVVVVLSNLLVDLLYAYLDPRVRY
jgi:peptide/nickel transport system permease protein